MFDDIFALLWEYKEIILIILGALLLFIFMMIIARLRG